MITELKFFEVRDRMTLIPVMAVRFNPMALPASDAEAAERFLLRRSGFNGQVYVSLTKLADGDMTTAFDAFSWQRGGTRTLFEAHRHIIAHWAYLKTGDVIDVEFLAGETQTPKISERLG